MVISRILVGGSCWRTCVVTWCSSSQCSSIIADVIVLFSTLITAMWGVSTCACVRPVLSP